MTDGVVLITTSPIPSHPSTAIIDTTIASIRERTDWPILIVADGVRPELEHRRAQYEQYLDALRAWCVKNDVGYIVHADWHHQAGIVRDALDDLGSPADVLLFCEHDMLLTSDIPFDRIAAVIEAGDANVIRLAGQPVLPPDWEYLMLDPAPIDIGGLPLRRTRQFSTWAHFASVQWYRDIFDRYFDRSCRSLIEWMLYPIVANSPTPEEWKLYLYQPEGDIQRCEHTYGRGDDPQFPALYAYPDGQPAGGSPPGWRET